MANDELKKNKVGFKDEIATIERDVDYFSGYLTYFPNPDSILETEANGEGIKLYDKIEKDSHAYSVLQTRYLSIVGKEWEVIPADAGRGPGRPAKNTREQQIADFVAKVFENANFDQMRSEILQAILYGYYVIEVLWDVNAQGKVIVKKFVGKHPRRFCFTTRRELRLITPEALVEGIPVPNRKFIIFQWGDSDNPYGKGLGQKLWWPVWFKKHGIKFWLVFLEKYGMPTTVGKYPAGTPKEKQDELLSAIKAIQTASAIKIPDGMLVELLEATRQGQATYETLCEYMDRQISKTVLGQTLTSDTSQVGALATAKVHNTVRQDLMEADADLLDACLNETVIKWLVDYNFAGVTVYPKIMTYTSAKPDLAERSGIDKTLAKDIRLPMAKSYFYQTYGVQEPGPNDELVNPATDNAPWQDNQGSLSPLSPLSPFPGNKALSSFGSNPSASNKAFSSFGSDPSAGNKAFSSFGSNPSAGNKAFSPFGSATSAGNKALSSFGSDPSSAPDMATASRSFLDGLTEEAVKEAQILFMNLAKPIQDLVMNAGSLEEIRDKVLETYDHIDAQSLENLMAQVFTLARLAGVAKGKDAIDNLAYSTAV